MPALSRFSARDGTDLAYRHYPARGEATGKVAILVHGSSGSSAAAHALADALAARGIDTYAPDIRGHGGSGTRGDVAYLGQLEDDMADLVALIRKTSSAPITLLGHSAGGGFALRWRALRSRTSLRAPSCLRPISAMTRRPTGRIRRLGRRRPAALLRHRDVAPDRDRLLRRVADAGLCGAGQLGEDPGIELFLPADAQFRDPRLPDDLAAVTRPLTLIAGADDELMLSDKYADAIHAVLPSAEVKLIAGANHMDVVTTAKAVNEIADYVATHGAAGT